MDHVPGAPAPKTNRLEGWPREARQMSGRLIFAAAVLTIVANHGVAAPLVCPVDQKFVCSSQNCRSVLFGRSYNRVDPERRTFARCDAKGCEEYAANFRRSGQFTNIEIVPGTLAKLSYIREDASVPLQAPQLVEVVTTGLTVLVSYGTCSELTP
jgi:hypothetical protein